eukprot:Gb_02204 [translate_table: standard]
MSYNSRPKAKKPAPLMIQSVKYPMAASRGYKPSIGSPKLVQSGPRTVAVQSAQFSPEENVTGSSPKACLCSPTTHPGSFRCRLHRSSQTQWVMGGKLSSTSVPAVAVPPTVPNTVQAQ